MKPLRQIAGWAVPLLLALAVLNIGLTHHNLWPTPWVRLSSEFSIELAVFVFALGVAGVFGYRVGPRVQWGLAVLFLLLVVGRYIDVTAPALFGRRIDLYWDLQYVPAIGAMVIDGWSLLRIAALVAGGFFVFTLLLLTAWWAIGVLCHAVGVRPQRAFLFAASGVLLAVYTASMTSDALDWEREYAIPITPVYASQVADIYARLTGPGPGEAPIAAPVSLPPFTELDGRDVFVIFLESYGRIAVEGEAYAERVVAALADLQRDASADGWQSRSAFFTAPTFGGSSWLSHTSFLSGRAIRTHDAYQMFLHGEAEHLVDRFRAAGYRTVMLVPGIRGAWPAGLAMRFDAVVSSKEIAYDGPGFGWWNIPDQISFDRLYRLEVAVDARPPLFVVFPTVMSHFPFGPTPPYVKDWSRLAGVSPFDARDIEAAHRLGDALSGDRHAAYLRSMVYDLQMVGGFLANRAPPDALVLVIGDHQPPAAISGEDAKWDVPVHVFARDAAVLAPFEREGFGQGTLPGGASIGGIERLAARLLEAIEARPLVERHAGTD